MKWRKQIYVPQVQILRLSVDDDDGSPQTSLENSPNANRRGVYPVVEASTISSLMSCKNDDSIKFLNTAVYHKGVKSKVIRRR